jgi:hypothetical protein
MNRIHDYIEYSTYRIVDYMTGELLQEKVNGLITHLSDCFEHPYSIKYISSDYEDATITDYVILQ